VALKKSTLSWRYRDVLAAAREELGGDDRVSPGVLSLFFVPILARHIVLEHLVRADFPSRGVRGVFHAHHNVSLERVSFFEKFVHALRI
jgi:hypothetical protein